MGGRSLGWGLSLAAIVLAVAPVAQGAVPATCPGPEDAAFGSIATTTAPLMRHWRTATCRCRSPFLQERLGCGSVTASTSPTSRCPNGLNNNTLDLSVYEPLHAGHTILGPDELRGSSGSAVRDTTIAVNGFSSEAVYEAAPKGYVSGRTTRAYEPGPIPDGEWVAELGLAAISTPTEGNLDNAVAWRVDVQTTSSPAFADDPYSAAAYDSSAAREDPGWYAGDFHVHGEHEPGNALMRETFDYAFAPVSEGGAGLDFVQLVDHNNTVAYGEIGKLQAEYPDNLISRGTEVTTYKGHTNSLAASGPGRLSDRADLPPRGERLADPGARGPPAVRDLQPGPRARRLHADQPPDDLPFAVPLLSAFCRGCPWDYTPAANRLREGRCDRGADGPAGARPAAAPRPEPLYAARHPLLG